MTLAFSTQFLAIGTSWRIDSDTTISDAVMALINQRAEQFDKTYSRFRPDSLVTQISEKAGEYKFPNDARAIISFYDQLYRLTDGRVSPLIGQALERAGYDANYSFQIRPQLPVPDWDIAAKWNDTTLRTTTPVTIDIGAAGKGYLIDSITDILRDAGVNEVMIDASGDIRHVGTSSRRIGLEHPVHDTKIIGVVEIQNESLCASASNRRTWGEGMHHIIDPSSLSPVRDIIATWVIASSAMTADGIATALFFTDAEELAKELEFSYVRMHSDGSVDYSHNFTGELFS